MVTIDPKLRKGSPTDESDPSPDLTYTGLQQPLAVSEPVHGAVAA